jgi:hypothetical protein
LWLISISNFGSDRSFAAQIFFTFIYTDIDGYIK